MIRGSLNRMPIEGRPALSQASAIGEQGATCTGLQRRRQPQERELVRFPFRQNAAGQRQAERLRTPREEISRWTRQITLRPTFRIDDRRQRSRRDSERTQRCCYAR
jgi:hypothetical protein